MFTVIVALIFSLVLLTIIYALHNIIGGTLTNYILGVFTVFFAVIVNDLKKHLDQYERSIDQTSTLGKLAKTLQLLFSMIGYFDLSLLLLSIMVLCHVSYHSFVNSLAGLANEGFVNFPEGKNGLSHLMKYAGGYIYGTTLSIVLGLYGFANGFQSRKMSFKKLLYSISFGLFLSIAAISISRGRWTGLDNLRGILETSNTEIPIGPEYFIPFILFGLAIFAVFLFPAYVWVFYLLGLGMGILLNKTWALTLRDQNSLNINQAAKEQLIEDTKDEDQIGG